MVALVLNPNDELIIKNYTSTLLRENNAQEILLYPSFPFFYLFEEEFSVSKDFIKNISVVKIFKPVYKENKVISELELNTCENKCYKAKLILAETKKPSSRIKIMEKGFVESIKIFRIADVDFFQENNLVTWKINDSLWKKL